jgi:hypothetical protein
VTAIDVAGDAVIFSTIHSGASPGSSPYKPEANTSKHHKKKNRRNRIFILMSLKGMTQELFRNYMSINKKSILFLNKKSLKNP